MIRSLHFWFCRLTSKSHYCTEVRFASFLSCIFTTMAVINPPEKKLANCASVHCCQAIKSARWIFWWVQIRFLSSQIFPICLQGFTIWANDDRALNGMEEIVLFFYFIFIWFYFTKTFFYFHVTLETKFFYFNFIFLENHFTFLLFYVTLKSEKILVIF